MLIKVMVILWRMEFQAAAGATILQAVFQFITSPPFGGADRRFALSLLNNNFCFSSNAC